MLKAAVLILKGEWESAAGHPCQKGLVKVLQSRSHFLKGRSHRLIPKHIHSLVRKEGGKGRSVTRVRLPPSYLQVRTRALT